MTLYEIEEALASCVKLDDTRAVDTETGEIIDLEAIEALEMQREEKLENVAKWIKNLKADAVAYKAEKMAFAERQKAAERKIESLEWYLLNHLDKKFETDHVKVTFRKSQVCEILDEKKVPAEFLVPQEPKINKAEIKKALKAGRKFEFADLRENRTVTVK